MTKDFGHRHTQPHCKYYAEYVQHCRQTAHTILVSYVIGVNRLCDKQSRMQFINEYIFGQNIF